MTTAIAPDRGSVDLAWNLGPAQEIGYYEAPLPADAFARLLGLLDQSGFDRLAAGSVPPGGAVISIGKNFWSGQGDVIRGWWVPEYPKVLQPVLDELHALTDALRKHPVRVIRGEASLPASITTRDAVAIAVTIHSVGKEPVKIDNPFHKRMEEALTVRLFLRRDKPWDQLREGEQIQVDCTLAQIRPADPKAKIPSGRQVTLAPKGALQFTVYKKLMLSPGRYLGEITYLTSQVKNDDASIRGGLLMQVAPFEVKAP